MFNFTPRIDTAQVQQKVQADINNTQSKKITQEQFFQAVRSYQQDSGKDEDIAFDEMYSDILKRGFIIEGVNDSPEQVQSQVRQSVQPNAMQKMLGGSIVGLRNLTRGAVSAIPEAVSNVAGGAIGIADKLTEGARGRNLARTGIDKLFTAIGRDSSKLPENLLQDLSQSIIDDGVDTKEKLQEALGVDPDTFMTKTGEFITNVGGTIAIPLGSATKAPKIVQTGLANLQTKAPKLYNILTTGGRGAVEAGKFGVVSEGETDFKEMAIGGGLGLTFGAIGKALKTPTAIEIRKEMFDRMGKLATKIAPSRTTAQQIQKNIDKSIDGAFIIRATDPTMKLTGPDAVQNSLELAQQTRKNLLTQMKEARGNGTTNLKPVISWIDDMLEALQKGGKSKLSGTQLDEFKELAKMDSNVVIRMLQQQKEELLSPAKSLGGVLDLEDLDNIIIGNNSKLSDLFGKTTNLSENQGIKTIGAINTQLVRLLDNVSGDGKVFRGLKQQYSNVRTYEDNLNKIYAQLLRKKDAGLGDYADVFILSNMGQSLVTGDVSGLAKAGLQKVIKEQVKKQNDVNFVLETLFKKIDRELGIDPSTIAEGVKRVAGGIADKSTGASTVGVAGGVELQNAIID